MYKQIIIVRKDLNMSPGKLAAQVSHASMAFLTDMIRKNTQEWCFDEDAYPLELYDGNKMPILYLDSDIQNLAETARKKNLNRIFYKINTSPFTMIPETEYQYLSSLIFDRELFKQWIDGSFTKVVLQARNRNHLMKAVNLAESMGLYIQQDFFSHKR